MPVMGSDAARAHCAGLQNQSRYGVRYSRSRAGQTHAKVFCRAATPGVGAAATATAHRKKRRPVADEIYLVAEGARPTDTIGAPPVLG